MRTTIPTKIKGWNIMDHKVIPVQKGQFNLANYSKMYK